MSKARYTFALVIGSISLLLLQGCNKKRSGVWDDHKSALNFKEKEQNALWGSDDLTDQKEGVFGVQDNSFVALHDEDLQMQFADNAIPQSDLTPGELNSGIPSISHFKDPTEMLSTVFRNVYFNTNEHIIRSQDSLLSIEKISTYLKAHPETYVFIEGHADQRGAEAYNLALGSRRSNYVRSLLVQQGVNPNQLFTISYGKERLIDPANNPQAWSKNRRAQFKIYEKTSRAQ